MTLLCLKITLRVPGHWELTQAGDGHFLLQSELVWGNGEAEPGEQASERFLQFDAGELRTPQAVVAIRDRQQREHLPSHLLSLGI
jgi:hypothetical protein